jgi:hypothetical protein
MKFLTFMCSPVGRGIRLLLGAILIALAVNIGGTVAWALGGFALLPIATGILGLCPINPLVGRPLRCGAECNIS